MDNGFFIVKTILCLLLLLELNNWVYSAQTLTDLYETQEGNVVLTTHCLKISHQYLYSPYGISHDLFPHVLSIHTPMDIRQNHFRYTGQVLDPSTGLMLLGKLRNYMSEIGRFIQPDTYNSFSKTQINNEFAYVSANPMIYNDPTGHMPVLISGIISGIRNQFNPVSIWDGFTQPWKNVTALYQKIRLAIVSENSFAFGNLMGSSFSFDLDPGFMDVERSKISVELKNRPQAHLDDFKKYLDENFEQAHSLINQRINELSKKEVQLKRDAFMRRFNLLADIKQYARETQKGFLESQSLGARFHVTKINERLNQGREQYFFKIAEASKALNEEIRRRLIHQNVLSESELKTSGLFKL